MGHVVTTKPRRLPEWTVRRDAPPGRVQPGSVTRCSQPGERRPTAPLTARPTLPGVCTVPTAQTPGHPSPPSTPLDAHNRPARGPAPFGGAGSWQTTMPKPGKDGTPRAQDSSSSQSLTLAPGAAGGRPAARAHRLHAAVPRAAHPLHHRRRPGPDRGTARGRADDGGVDAGVVPGPRVRPARRGGRRPHPGRRPRCRSRSRARTAGARPPGTRTPSWVSYRVYGREMSVRTNWIEADFAMLNGAPTFLTLADDDAGRPHDVFLELPAAWGDTARPACRRIPAAPPTPGAARRRLRHPRRLADRGRQPDRPSVHRGRGAPRARQRRRVGGLGRPAVGGGRRAHHPRAAPHVGADALRSLCVPEHDHRGRRRASSMATRR